MEEKKFLKDSAIHNIVVENREKISISGVLNVESFDEEKIILETSEGMLTLEGENLHINRLSVDDGEMMVEGYIYSFVYSDGESTSSGGNFFAKLFKWQEMINA